MSYSIKISAKDRATGRFMSRIHRALIKAIAAAKEEKKMTQMQIAESMGVDKSVISRILNGEGNLTLKTIGDISWVMGLHPEFKFVPIEVAVDTSANHPAMGAVLASPPAAPRQETTKPVEISAGTPALKNRPSSGNLLVRRSVAGQIHVY